MTADTITKLLGPDLVAYLDFYTRWVWPTSIAFAVAAARR